jgi:hypothetical protein
VCLTPPLFTDDGWRFISHMIGLFCVRFVDSLSFRPFIRSSELSAFMSSLSVSTTIAFDSVVFSNQTLNLVFVRFFVAFLAPKFNPVFALLFDFDVKF